VLLAPAPDALDHDAVAAAERNRRWNGGVGDPVNMHLKLILCGANDAAPEIRRFHVGVINEEHIAF
jgi:hypothetical protein